VTGRDLQRAVIELGGTLGWRVAFFPPVKTDKGWRVPVGAQGKGWPDLILVRERLIAVEIKGDGDRLRPDQTVWLSAMRTAGIEAFVWSPKDWGVDGPVETELKRRHRQYPSVEEAA
jgi:hypothetical protein